SDVVFVYFDLETGGFSYNDDILQIAMKCGDSFYTSYVTPTKSIAPKASSIHGTEFSKVIVGYCDTLLLCKEKFPKKKSAGDLQLTTLVNEFLKIPFPNAHDAYADVCMLEQLTLSLFTNDKLIAEYFSFSTAISNLQNSLNSKKTEKTLAPLQKILSFYTIKRIASAGIDLDTLRQKFTEYGEAELVKFLQNARSTKGKPKKRGNFLPTKQINLIIRYLKE
ncbi:hypothetical protein PV325_010897, partial [Microctonus aethiopoides]